MWVLGEVRKHIQAAGMGIVVEYAGSGGKPVWKQPLSLGLGLQPLRGASLYARRWRASHEHPAGL